MEKYPSYIFIDTKTGKADYREDASLLNSITFAENNGEEARFDVGCYLNPGQVEGLIEYVKDSMIAYVDALNNTSDEEYEKVVGAKFAVSEAIASFLEDNVYVLEEMIDFDEIESENIDISEMHELTTQAWDEACEKWLEDYNFPEDGSVFFWWEGSRIWFADENGRPIHTDFNLSGLAGLFQSKIDAEVRRIRQEAKESEN